MLRFWKKMRPKRPLADVERRREPRFEDASTVILTPRDSSGRGRPTLYYARALNASPSGLKIDCEVPFPLATVLSIRLESPRTRRLIQAAGEVKWVTPIEGERHYEIGLEIVDTSVRNIMELIEHIYKA